MQPVFPVTAVSAANLVAFYLPMHTATRLAVKAIERVREWNPGGAYLLLRIVRSTQ